MTRGLLVLGGGLVLAGVVALGVAFVGGASGARSDGSWSGVGSMMGGRTTGGAMMGGAPAGPGGMNSGMMRGGMMRGGWNPTATAAPGPGESGFVAGTAASPRIVAIHALADDRFSPSSITIAAGETITFVVTGMGPDTHEFMVGPAADVAANKDGTPEVTGIGMMVPKSLTYTFSGSGPFSYACHVSGHYEAGMVGTIVVR
jgi:plastocyanin